MATTFISLITVVGLALASITASAQSADKVVEAPQVVVQQSSSAAVMTRDMSTRLKLNEGQYIKLYEVNKTRISQLAQIEHNFKNDPIVRSSKISELDAQYEQACSSILTPSQLSQLHEDKPTQPNTMPAGTGNGVG